MNWLNSDCDIIDPLLACCVKTYNNIVDINEENVCAESFTDKKIWHSERKFRVTGSWCYNLFTYKKDNWETKAVEYFIGKNINNCYTRHGIKYESVALKSFEQNLNRDEKVIYLGLVICRQHPWMAYSPDAILFLEEIPQTLIEVKCPYAGIYIY